jgi:urea transport system ATP-binding protein
MLAIDNLSFSYQGSRILKGVTLRVPEQRVVCLMGRNGVGKTTTLKNIMGLLNPSDGRVSLAGQDITSLPPDRRARLGLGYVPQGREIFSNLTVMENLQLAQVASGHTGSSMDRVFELFPALSTMLRRKGGVLSGGQQQQLAIARALLTEPKVLVLDEPTEGIQPSIIDEIGDTIRRLKKEGTMAILLVEQCLDFAQALADSFYIMQKGVIVADGPIAELTDQVVHQHLSV